MNTRLLIAPQHTTPNAPLWQDRDQAGRELGMLLLHNDGPWRKRPSKGITPTAPPLVLALPRGGVAVAAPLAMALELELATWSVRKMTLPEDPEYALGALSLGPTIIWSDSPSAISSITNETRSAMIAAQEPELIRRQRTYGDPRPNQIRGRCVIVVDDGVATGLTARAALASLKRLGAHDLVLAVPVIDRTVIGDLLADATHVAALAVVPDLIAVGRWFVSFDQLTEADVSRCLQRSNTSVP